VASLRSAASERQQCYVPRLLDRRGQASLVWSADTGQAPGNYLSALRHELCEQPDVFVVDGFNLLHAKLADLLAAKVFSTPFATTASRGTRTRRTAFTTIRPVTGKGTVSTRRALSTRTSFHCSGCSNFFSHDAP
jgi:hypothetical protein